MAMAMIMTTGDESSVRIGRFEMVVKEVIGKLRKIMDAVVSVIGKHLRQAIEAFFRNVPSWGFQVHYNYPDDAPRPTVKVGKSGREQQ